MTLFLILLPFAAFTLLMLVASPAISLFAAAAIVLALMTRDLMAGRSLKMLAAGSAVIFLVIGGYIALIDPHLSAMSVRIAVDVGILAIGLVSLVMRAPFTLQYAREIVDAETAQFPSFRRVNYILTFAWTGAFALMLMANMLMIYAPSLPLWVGVGLAFAARNFATYFTRWYPQHHRTQMALKATAI